MTTGPKIVTCPECGTDMGEQHLAPHLKVWHSAATTTEDATANTSDMSAMRTQAKIGFALLALAACLAIAASLMWSKASEQAETDSHVNELFNAMVLDAGEDFSLRDETIEPNHTPSIVLLGLAALAVLSAVPLIAIRPGGPTTSAPARDLSARLTELAGLRDKGMLTEAEFDEAKRKLLDDPSG
jgi:hypothetical protein